MTDVDATASDAPAEEYDPEEDVRGTVWVTFAFLAMCVFMFGWAYYLLILRA